MTGNRWLVVGDVRCEMPGTRYLERGARCLYSEVPAWYRRPAGVRTGTRCLERDIRYQNIQTFYTTPNKNLGGEGAIDR
jgi:hypothetical protein